MNTKRTFLTALVLTILLTGCKKKDSASDPEPEPTPTTTGAPVATEYTFSQSIGTSGAGFNEFNFNMNGQEHAWTMTTDGTFIYVGDFGNNCVKKIDLSTNTIVGWYGYKNSAWGFYTSYTSAPDPFFKPFRLVYRNNTIYAFSKKNTTGKCNVFKFDVSAASAMDSSRNIPEYSFFTAAVDNFDDLFIVTSDSIKKYESNGNITRFGGFGSADGKLNNSGSLVQALCKSDTLVVLDAGNDRIQKFSNNGSFISKFAVTSSKSYANMHLEGNKYYLVTPNMKLAEYSSGGTLLNTYTIKNNPSGFSPSQKQFLVIGNKVVFQDMYAHKLHIYTK
jgi:hypothetical protein